MKRIPLTKGYFALVDDADFEAANAHKWHVGKYGQTVYAKRHVYTPDGKHTTQCLHQFLLPGVPRIIHRDGDSLNNQRENLLDAWCSLLSAQLPAGMRICLVCKIPKPLSDFYKDLHNRDGLRSRCRACECESRRAKRAADPEARDKDRAKYAANPEPKRRAARARYAETPGKMRSHLRERDLNKKYGITTAEFDRKLAEQGNACDICRNILTKTGHVDHCHQTGKVRGILCQDCNLGLGRFKDSAQLMIAGIAYLTKHLPV